MNNIVGVGFDNRCYNIINTLEFDENRQIRTFDVVSACLDESNPSCLRTLNVADTTAPEKSKRNCIRMCITSIVRERFVRSLSLRVELDRENTSDFLMFIHVLLFNCFKFETSAQSSHRVPLVLDQDTKNTLPTTSQQPSLQIQQETKYIYALFCLFL